jgi:hypothetical protein
MQAAHGAVGDLLRVFGLLVHLALALWQCTGIIVVVIIIIPADRRLYIDYISRPSARLAADPPTDYYQESY